VDLDASCPRCGSVLDGAVCPSHGTLAPFWRPVTVDYAGLARILEMAAPVPTYLPWPLGPGWSVCDVGAVGSTTPGTGLASVTRIVGSTALDDSVEVTVISEDPGVGLGARCAGVTAVDPGVEFTADVPTIKVRVEGRAVPLWALEPVDDTPLTRAAFVGEAHGRWLWVVVRPAAAALLMSDDWLLIDVTGMGPEALEMPFGGDRGEW
jgi:hypothetical protein